MLTHDYLDDHGRLLSFEVPNTLFGRRRLVRFVARIPEARVVRSEKWFSWPAEEFCEFEYRGALFSASEPFGDSSRYLIAPKPPRWMPETIFVRDTFRAAGFREIFLARRLPALPGPTAMGPRFLVLLDESCLVFYPSPGAAAEAIEAIDVERELRCAFDDTGIPYRVERIRPNRHGCFSVTNGTFRFVPTGAADPASLLELIRRHPSARTHTGDAVDLEELTVRLRAG